ncbi:Reverse transcriptase domain [Arabidopsis suecica]|uniref:Reverse transcriptase domain n=1 Tax=Arabidopsis suecica TaxID=45249 RepID=A0A8T2BPF1_ARASU|nr:Reverse transcriptase domain [Arabidopsis suecica]
MVSFGSHGWIDKPKALPTTMDRTGAFVWRTDGPMSQELDSATVNQEKRDERAKRRINRRIEEESNPYVGQVAKDQSTLQYTTVINQRTPLVPASVVFDLGGRELWVDCDKDYVSSTYQSPRCNYAKCSRAGSTSCGTCFSPPRPGCRLASETVGMAGMGRHNIGLPPQFTAAFSFSQKFAVCLTSGKGLQTMPLLINPVSIASAFSQVARNITRVASEKLFGDACFSTKNVGVTCLGYAVPEIQLLLRSNDVVWRIFRANSMVYITWSSLHLLTLIICSTIFPSQSSPSPTSKRPIYPLVHNRHQQTNTSRPLFRRLRPRWSRTLGGLRQRLRLFHLPISSLQLRRVLTRRLHHLRHYVSLLPDLAVVTTLAAALQITNFIFDCGATFLLKGLASGTVGMAGMGRHNIGLPPQFAAAFSFSQKFAVCLTSGKGLQTMPLLINPVSTCFCVFPSIGFGGTKISSVNPYTVLESSIYKAFTSEFVKQTAARNITRVASEKPFGDACFSTKNVGVTRLGYAAPEIQLLLRSNDVVWRIFRANSMQKTNLPSSTQPSSTNAHLSSPLPSSSTSVVENSGWTATKTTSLPLTNLLVATTPSAHAPAPPAVAHVSLLPDLAVVTTLAAALQITNFIFDCGATFLLKGLASGTVGMAGMGRHNIGLPPQFAAAFSFSQKFAVCLTSGKGLQTMPLLINPVSTASAFSQAARNITRVASEKPFGDACFSTKNVGVTRLGYAAPEIQLLLRSNDVVWRIFRANSMQKTNLPSSTQPSSTNAHLSSPLPSSSTSVVENSGWTATKTTSLPLTNLLVATTPSAHAPAPPAVAHVSLLPDLAVVTTLAAALQITNFIFDCGATFLLKGLASGTVGMAGMGRHNIGLPPQFAAAFSFSQKFAVCLTSGKGLQTMPLLINPFQRLKINASIGFGGTKISSVNPYTVLESSIYKAFTLEFVKQTAARNITRVASEKPFGDACFSTKNVGVTRLGYAAPEIQLLLRSNDVVWRIFRANSMQKTNLPSSTQPSSTNAHLSSPLPSSSTSVVENSGWTATKTTSLPLTNLLVATTPSAHAPAPPAVAHVSLLPDLAVVTTLAAALQITNFIFDCGATFLLKGLASGTVGMAGMGRHNIGLPPQFAAAFSFSQKFAVCLTSGKGLQTMPLLINPVSLLLRFPKVRNPLSILMAIKIIEKKQFQRLKINASIGFGGTKISSVNPYTALESSIYKAFTSEFVKQTAARNITRVASEKPFGDACFSTKNVGVTRLGYAAPEIQLLLRSNDVVWRIFRANSMQKTNLPSSTQPSSTNAHLSSPLPSSSTSVVENSGWTATKTTSLPLTNLLVATTPSAHAPAPPAVAHVSLLPDLAVVTTLAAALQITNFIFDCGATFLLKGLASGTVGMAGMGRHNIGLPPQFAAAFSFSQKFAVCLTSGKGLQTMPLLINPVSTASAFSQAARNITRVASEKPFGDACFSTKNVGVTRLGYAAPEIQLLLRSNDVVWRIFRANSMQKTNLPSSTQPSSTNAHLSSPLPSSSTSVVENSGWTATKTTSLPLTNLLVATTPSAHAPAPPAVAHVSLLPDLAVVTTLAAALQITNFIFDCGATFLLKGLASGTVGMAGMGRHNIGLPPQFAAAFSFSQKFAVCLTSGKGLQTMPLLINPVSFASAFSQALESSIYKAFTLEFVKQTAARNITRVASEKPFGDACFSTKNVGVTRLGYAAPEIQLLLRSNDVVWRIFRANSMQKTNLPSSTQPSSTNAHLSSPLPSSSTSVVENSGWTATKTTSLPLTNLLVATTPSAHAPAPPPTAHVFLLPDLAVVTTLAAALQITNFIFDCGATFLLKGLASGTVGMAGMGRHNIGLPPQFAAAFSFSQKFAVCLIPAKVSKRCRFSSIRGEDHHESSIGETVRRPVFQHEERRRHAPGIRRSRRFSFCFVATTSFGGSLELTRCTQPSSTNAHLSSPLPSSSTSVVENSRWIATKTTSLPLTNLLVATTPSAHAPAPPAAAHVSLLPDLAIVTTLAAALQITNFIFDCGATFLLKGLASGTVGMAGMGRHNIGLPPQFAAAFSFSQKFAVCLTSDKGLQMMPLLINPVSTASAFSQAARNITRVASEKPFGDACFSTKNVGVKRLGYAAPEIQLLLRSNDVVWRIFRANSMKKTNLPSSTQPSSTNAHLSSPLPSSSTSVVENSGWTETKTTSLPLTNLLIATTPSAHAPAPPAAAHVSLLPDLAIVTTLAAALQITNFIFDCGATFLLKGLASGTVGMAGMGRHNIGLPPQFAAAFSFSQKFAVCLTSGKGLQMMPLLINPVSTASAFSQAARNITRVASEKPFGDACFSTKNVGVKRLGYAAPEIQLLLRSNDVVWRIFRANSMVSQKTNLPSSTQPSSTNAHLSSPLPSSSTSVVENSGWTETKTTSLPLTNLLVATTPSAHAPAPPAAAHVSLLPDLAIVTTLAAALHITNFIFDCGATFLLKGLASGTVGMAGMGRHNIGLPPQFAAAFSFSQKFAVCLTSGKGLQMMPLLINPVSTASAFSQAARNITRVASEKPFGDACFSTKNVGVKRLGYAAPEIQLLLRRNDVVWRIFRANSMQKTNLPSSTQPSSTNAHLSSPLPSSSTSVVENSGWTATKTTSLPLTNLLVATTPSAHAPAPPAAAHVSLLPDLAIVTTLAAALQITNFIFDCGATFLLKGLASGTVGMAGMGRYNIGLRPQFAAAFSFSQKFAVCLTSGKGLQTMPLLINPVSTASAFSQVARNITRVASEKPFGDACFSTKNVAVTRLGYAVPEIQLLLRSNDVVWRIFRANSMVSVSDDVICLGFVDGINLNVGTPDVCTIRWTATKTTSLPLTNLLVATTPSAHAPAPPAVAHVSLLPDLAVVTTLAAALQITNFIFDCGAMFLLKGLASGTVGMAGMGRHNIGLPPQFAAAFCFSQKFAVCLTSGKGLQTTPLLINPVSTASAFSQAARNITRVASEKPFGDACFSTKNVGVKRLGYAVPEIQLLLHSNDVVWRIFRANSMALQGMSIDDDKPLILSNHSKFCSIERNQCSILGRFLNPTHQRMSNWILDMPRIWRLYSRVRGIALSQERFQFIFNSEADLDEILKTGVWTQDDWCVVMEKWIEKPPDDYLMFMPVWIRLRNVPVNYYTEETIKEVAACVGKVIQANFDSEKSQAQDYVRVQVLFDVRNPLRNSKDVQLPTGEIVSITFDYERIRKRCFHCQRLTHEKNLCPFDQLSLIADPGKISKDINKQKGLVMHDGGKSISNQDNHKLLADAMKLSSSSKFPDFSKKFDDDIFSSFSDLEFSSGFTANSSEAGSSGLSLKQKNPKKRKVSLLRQSKVKSDGSDGDQVNIEDSLKSVKVFKRKAPVIRLESSNRLEESLDNSIPEGNAKRTFPGCFIPHGDIEYRSLLWERISTFGLQRKEAWCMIGDFNEILSNKEKLGGPLRLISSFRPFKDMLNDCGMHELGSTGNSFTWGGTRNYQWIQCKLDRCFGNPAWFEMFPNSHQWFLEKLGSDHRPVLVKFINDQELFRGQFRFDKRMADDPSLANVIHSSWNSEISTGNHSSIFSIAECRRNISIWKKSADFNAKNRIQRLRKELDDELSVKCPCWERISEIKEQLSVAFSDEEIFWRQKSREKWMFEGDKITQFFHASVKSNRVKNSLSFLLDQNGVEHTLNREKGQIASLFFNDLFKSSSPSLLSSMLDGFQSRVSDAMNQQLTKEVTEEEIYKAVFSINSESAPGPDGFTALFFQKYWSVVKFQVIEEIMGFFKSGVLPKEWNHTHLCLIPKISNPQRMTDMRPISLCSVLYKIVSKIISSRLKVYLPDIVSPTQSAYVAERLVSDNILVAHEIMHSLKTNPVFSNEFMAFKTDMSKAYDRVEWSFLEGILLALGFDKKWISWIMGCVSSVSYSVLINGQPFGYIKPERGIRQGDPLSPLLFVLCTEALIHFLKKANSEGKAAGIQFNNAGPSVNHLLFADDTLLICKANKEECEEMLNCLSKYEAVSGQMINVDKSAITFGVKVDQEVKDWIKRRSGIHLEGGSGRYLGLPDCLSGSKQQLFGFIRDKLKDRMSGWYAKTLSQGGKEILLKSIAMALPVYAMTCFKLPISLCKNLTSVMMDYWWNNLQHEKKIHWISWQKLAMPKLLGGIGFKDLQCFNQALLAKQAWRLFNEKESLFSQIFKSRYFLNSDFLHAPYGTRPSYAWRSILYGRELLTQGLKKVIVKSGYDMSSRKAHPILFKEAETTPSISPLFDSLWKIQTAPKIKVFIWKALKGAIAVEDRLRTRGINVKDGCLMCEEENETVNHILFQCPLARQVWALSNVPFPVSGFGSSIFANMSHLMQLSKVRDIPQELRFGNSWILWILWKNRNKLLFEGEGALANKIVSKAFDDGNQWLAAQKSRHQDDKQKRNENAEWIPPLSGELKCNIGFAWSKKKKLSGAAWIVRNSNGQVLLHSRRSYSQVMKKTNLWSSLRLIFGYVS